MLSEHRRFLKTIDKQEHFDVKRRKRELNKRLRQLPLVSGSYFKKAGREHFSSLA